MISSSYIPVSWYAVSSLTNYSLKFFIIQFINDAPGKGDCITFCINSRRQKHSGESSSIMLIAGIVIPMPRYKGSPPGINSFVLISLQRSGIRSSSWSIAECENQAIVNQDNYTNCYQGIVNRKFLFTNSNWIVFMLKIIKKKNNQVRRKKTRGNINNNSTDLGIIPFQIWLWRPV